MKKIAKNVKLVVVEKKNLRCVFESVFQVEINIDPIHLVVAYSEMDYCQNNTVIVIGVA